LEHGAWQGFSSSLDTVEAFTPQTIKHQMQLADQAMGKVLETLTLETPLKDGKPSYSVVQRMIEHEMHHQGQLINFIFCHRLPIPKSWNEKWALAYDD
jgi:hypothetical protein